MSFYYAGRSYLPTVPVADNEETARHDRIILRHSRENGPEVRIILGRDIQVGWVIGFFEQTIP